MSVVACRVYDDRYEIAADSISVRSYTQRKGDNTSASKLFEENGVIVGAVGSCDEASLLRIFLMTHGIASDTEGAILEFMSEFAEWKKKRTEKAGIENAYIIGLGSCVFHANGWFIEKIKTFEATGAGMDYALAAMHMGHGVEEAVATAIELSIYCEGPVQRIVHTY